MKKRFAILMCAAAAVASGCTKKEDTAKITEVKDAKVVISASILDTKAEYDNGMKSGYWNSTDRIGAYLYRNSGNGYAAQATNVTYTNSGEDRSPVAEFTTDSQFGVAEGDVMVGYYPFDEAQASTDASGSAGFSAPTRWAAHPPVSSAMPNISAIRHCFISIPPAYSVRQEMEKYTPNI